MNSKKIGKTAGFTMIEMIMAVAIMGILVAIAYPAYQDSVMKSHRADGIAAALSLQVAQERFRGSCKFYAQSIGAGDACGASAAASTVAGNATSNEGFYAISIAASSASGNSYTIVLTPTGTQADDADCSPMTIAYSAANPSGLKSPTDCW